MLRSQIHCATRSARAPTTSLCKAGINETGHNAANSPLLKRRLSTVAQTGTRSSSPGPSSHGNNESNTLSMSEMSSWSTIVWPLPSTYHDTPGVDVRRSPANFNGSPYHLRTPQEVVRAWHHLTPSLLPTGYSCDWSRCNLVHSFSSGAYYYDLGPLDLLFKITYELPDPIRGLMYRPSQKGALSSFIFQAGDGIFYDWNDETSELKRYEDVSPWTPVGEFARRLRSQGAKEGAMRMELVETKPNSMAECERRREEQFNKREKAEAYLLRSRGKIST
ncbi:hypothetical protein BDZ94DRAFT_115043 [Collybia nuda]|uniref:Uncharacterized protein n=1 Tax=Collybia nuda TaxID=64659 RepID=A0A9P6CAF4_9AGAR|nr:hypothetical protein BDZ94DRAFT_115043 [Collybia nuda]